MIFGAALLLLIGVTGFVVVRTHEPTSQVLALTFYGLLFGLLFFIFRAPDVALSQLTVGGLALPLMLMLAISRMRSHKERQGAKESDQQQ